MIIKYFDNIPFKLYRIVKTKNIVNFIVKMIKQEGYYVKIISSSKGIEIWVSENPRWFYRFGN